MEETKKEISLESEADTLLNSINSLSEYQIGMKLNKMQLKSYRFEIRRAFI